MRYKPALGEVLSIQTTRTPIPTKEAVEQTFIYEASANGEKWFLISDIDAPTLLIGRTFAQDQDRDGSVHTNDEAAPMIRRKVAQRTPQQDTVPAIYEASNGGKIWNHVDPQVASTRHFFESASQDGYVYADDGRKPMMRRK